MKRSQVKIPRLVQVPHLFFISFDFSFFSLSRFTFFLCFKKMAGENGSDNRTSALNLMTFNLRHDHHEDSPTSPFATPPMRDDAFNAILFGGEQPWSIRKWKIIDTILLYSPDVLALQVRNDIFYNITNNSYYKKRNLFIIKYKTLML